MIRTTTWYLAIDQFGYLTFARDLAGGQILHSWELLPSLSAFLPKDLEADALAQTYVFREGGLFCRYAPGFPMILAGVAAVFGESAVHYVNSVLFGLLIICSFWVARRALGSSWLGLGVALLVTLTPNYLLLWSISPLRDVPAHLAALTALGLLLPGSDARPMSLLRWATAGLLLGFAITIRVDAVLYLLPAAELAWLRRPWGRAEILVSILAVGIGTAPLLAYNWVATGNPLRPTQAMEIDGVLSERAPAIGAELATAVAALVPVPGEAHAAEEPSRRERLAAQLLQGGGLRLRHLGETLPQNLGRFRMTFGDLGTVLGLIGMITAIRVHPLFMLSVPYCIAAMLFFSLWTRPDPRYLAGAMLLFSLLVLHGARSLVALPPLLQRFGRTVATVSTLAIAVVVLWLIRWPAPEAASALPWVVSVLGVVVAACLVGSLFVGRRTIQVLLSVLLGIGLSGVAAWRSIEGFGARASFQEAQVQLARTTLEAALAPNSVVITTSDVGRPAENINYYTSASAVYLQELLRWGVSPGYFLDRVLGDGFSPYLLLPPEDAQQWIESPFVRPWFSAEMVAAIAPERAREYFVASAGHDGVELWLIRMQRRPEVLVDG